MYHARVNFDSDETIQFETSEAIVEYHEKRINVAVMITTKRIIFLQDINKKNMAEALNITGKFYTPPIFDPIEEIPKREITDCCYIKNGTEIVTNNENIFIFNYDLTTILCN